MAKLRKWQPARRGPLPVGISSDKILLICGAAAFGVLIFAFLQPDKKAQPEPRIFSSNPAAERERAIAAAQRAEAEERARQLAAIKSEQARQQAEMFNQRYNTDRMPVGSVNGGEPGAPATPQGFSVVKPALPTGQSGNGFREVKVPKTAQ